MNAIRVLVADDDDAFRQLVQAVLERMGLDVDQAGDGFLALRMCHEAEAEGRPYALVVLDLNMSPGWNGDEASIKLAELKPRPHILLCTGSTDNPMLNYAESYGFDAVLRKPFPTSDLMEMVAKLLDLEEAS